MDAGKQIEARDLYWEAVYDTSKRGRDKAKELLLTCIEKNPFVGVILVGLYIL